MKASAFFITIFCIFIGQNNAVAVEPLCRGDVDMTAFIKRHHPHDDLIQNIVKYNIDLSYYNHENRSDIGTFEISHEFVLPKEALVNDYKNNLPQQHYYKNYPSCGDIYEGTLVEFLFDNDSIRLNVGYHFEDWDWKGSIIGCQRDSTTWGNAFYQLPIKAHVDTTVEDTALGCLAKRKIHIARSKLKFIHLTRNSKGFMVDLARLGGALKVLGVVSLATGASGIGTGSTLLLTGNHLSQNIGIGGDTGKDAWFNNIVNSVLGETSFLRIDITGQLEEILKESGALPDELLLHLKTLDVIGSKELPMKVTGNNISMKLITKCEFGNKCPALRTRDACNADRDKDYHRVLLNMMRQINNGEEAVMETSVANGEGLWDVAERIYGSGKLYHLIYDQNKQLHEHGRTELLIGEKISYRPITHYASSSSIVLKDDSISKIAQRKSKNSYDVVINAENRNLIYPYQTYLISGASETTDVCE